MGTRSPCTRYLHLYFSINLSQNRLTHFYFVCGLGSISINIYFDDRIVPDLARSWRFELAPCPFNMSLEF